MFILAHIQTFIVQLNNVVLTSKSHFTLFIGTIKIKKNPQNFAVERQNSFGNEQKLVKIDYFNSDEEKLV